MQRICVIIPYFGRWPGWFELFLETCRFNPSVDWLFFTDLAPPPNAPPNAKFFPVSLEEFSRLASRRLGLHIDFSYPFKICDVRPAFADIFCDTIGDYQFWCWGDLDVFYGDLRSILTDRLLAENDVISPRFGFLAGELSLFRNVERVNSIYRESRDYEKVFTSDRCWNFCEFGFFRDRTVESMTHVLKRAAADGRVRFFSEDMLRTDRKLRGRPFRYYWQQGKLADLDSGENLLLYHFLDRKKSEAFDLPPMPESLPHGFVVTELGVEFMQQPLPVPRQRLGHWLGRLGKSARRWKRRLSVGRGE